MTTTLMNEHGATEHSTVCRMPYAVYHREENYG